MASRQSRSINSYFVWIVCVCMLVVHVSQAVGPSNNASAPHMHTTVGEIVKELISKLETTADEECVFYQWLDEHISNASSAHVPQHVQCDSMTHLLRSFAANSLYSLFFKDICNVIWHFDEGEIEANSLNAESKRLKYLINDFISHDNEHWEMYINDWSCLGLDGTDKHFSDLLAYLFSDFTLASRKAVYHTVRIDAKLNGDVQPEHRYVIIALLEHMSSQQLFPRLGILYDLYSTNCSVHCDLQYVSLSHCEAETNHIDISQYFDPIVIDKENARLLREYGDEFQRIMINLLNTFYTYQLNHFDSIPLW